MDCGPTCLKIVAKYYSRDFSIERLRSLSFITPIGTSLRGLMKAAEYIGFNTQCIQVPLNILLSDVKLPCILHWNENHYCVLYKIKRDKWFYISDPQNGRVKVNITEFEDKWLRYSSAHGITGIALALEPTAQFYNQEKSSKQNKFSSIFKYVYPYKNLLFQLSMGLLLGSFLQILLPLLTQKIVDFSIPNKRFDLILLILIAQLIILFSSATVELIRGWILLHLGTKVNISLISNFLSKLIRLPISFFDSRRTGDILQRVRDHTRIETFLTNHSLNIIFSFLNILVLGCVIFIYNYKVFVIYFVGCILYVLWVISFLKRRADIDNSYFDQQAENQSYIIEFVTSMQDVKINSCERRKKNIWAEIQGRLYNTRIRSLSLTQLQFSGGTLINQVKNLLISAFVASLVIKGELTIGAMIAIQYILGQLNVPIDNLISFFGIVQDANLSYERLEDIQNIKEETDCTDINIINFVPTGLDLEIKNLYFQYNLFSEFPIINNLSLLIPNGKQTAIVGVSGSGKTTLIKLLLGFYSSFEGEILLGGKNLFGYNLESWRKKCGVVMQDGFIYSDTISGNIAPSEDEINQSQLKYACRLALIKDFIEGLPQKYNTKIGREGLGLSQGQKQRILIARAIYKNPEFIFFDEATNSLDANNEREIMMNLQTFFQGRTSVVVAHRLSTVVSADQIVVVDNGQIIEIGNHKTLIGLKGKYYELIRNQLNI